MSTTKSDWSEGYDAARKDLRAFVWRLLQNAKTETSRRQLAHIWEYVGTIMCNAEAEREKE
ncbi:MAG: hypothetical protein E6Q97_37570 [Desulfurellales bacterium]|nr:MAG: hypothetical protein E6Q97_37570 [Desulfurellales bacterium]